MRSYDSVVLKGFYILEERDVEKERAKRDASFKLLVRPIKRTKKYMRS